MKFTSTSLSATLLFILTCLPQLAFADQNDSRLPELFDTLRTSNSNVVRRETENAIWQIWFDSGDLKVDKIMADARAAMQAGQLEQAETLYSRVIDTAPKYSEGWNRRATVRYYQRNFDGSLEDIEQTLKLEPRHFGAIWGQGMILGLRKNFTAAIDAFERLLSIKPDSTDARPRIEQLKQEMTKNAV